MGAGHAWGGRPGDDEQESGVLVTRLCTRRYLASRQADAGRLLNRRERAVEAERDFPPAPVGGEIGDLQELAVHPLGEMIAGFDGLPVGRPDEPEAGLAGYEAPERPLLLAIAADQFGID